MELTLKLVFEVEPRSLGLTAEPPRELRVPTGVVPVPGDVIGFDHLRFADGRAAAFEVLRRFHSSDAQGRITRIDALVGPLPESEFVQE